MLSFCPAFRALCGNKKNCVMLKKGRRLEWVVRHCNAYQRRSGDESPAAALAAVLAAELRKPI